MALIELRLINNRGCGSVRKYMHVLCDVCLKMHCGFDYSFQYYAGFSTVKDLHTLRACVYIYNRQLGSFGAPTFWLIDLTIATCHT